MGSSIGARSGAVLGIACGLTLLVGAASLPAFAEPTLSAHRPVETRVAALGPSRYLGADIPARAPCAITDARQGPGRAGESRRSTTAATHDHEGTARSTGRRRSARTATPEARPWATG